MITFGTNILVYAHRPDLPQHEQASSAVGEVLNASAQEGVRWPVIQGFLAVVTNPRILADPTPAARTIDHGVREALTADRDFCATSAEADTTNDKDD